MALGTPTLVGSAGATATSATTGSFTPTANALLIALCGARAAAATIPTISDSLGGTWVAVHANSDQDAGAIVANVFYQVVSGSPLAMTITASSAGATQTGIHVIEITGADTDFSNFVVDTDTVGDPSLTMAAFQASSLCLSLYANTAGSAVTSPAGHTELLDSTIATNLRMTSGYDLVSPSTTMSWTGTGSDTIGYGLEIKVPSSGATYNESRDEVLSVAEIPSVLLTAVGTLNEVLAIAETVSSLGEFINSISEVLTAIETVSSTTIFNRSISETITIIDTTTGGMLQTGAVAEILSAIDTVTVAHTKAGSVAEALSIAETVSAQLTAIGSRAEVLAIVEAVTGKLAISASRAEVLAIVEAVTGKLNISASRAEVLAIVEAVTGKLNISASRAEVLAIAEAVTGEIAAPAANKRSYALIIG